MEMPCGNLRLKDHRNIVAVVSFREKSICAENFSGCVHQNHKLTIVSIKV